MNKTKWLGVLRHVLTTAGGVLVTLGYIDEGIAKEAIGAVMTIAGVILSLTAPEKTTDI